MTGNTLKVKKHRFIAIDADEIIGMDYNESLNDLKIYLRGGGILSIEGKRTAKIWKQLTKDLPELFQEDFEEDTTEDNS